MNFRSSLLFLILVVGTMTISAQNNIDERVSFEGKTYIIHQVLEGESIVSICKSYKVDQKDLVAANSTLLFGLTPGKTIHIPLPPDPEFIEHKIKRKQTVFSIIRQYGISMDDLYRFNPEARKGVEQGQILRIPVKSDVPVEVIAKIETQEQPNENYLNNELSITTRRSYFKHQLKAGETLFELEKKYGISQDSILAINPFLRNGITSGLTIQIPTVCIPEVISRPENENEFIRHRVLKGETIYDIATNYKLRISQIKSSNPVLKYRDLMVDEELLIPNNSLYRIVFDPYTGDSIRVLPEYKTTYSTKGLLPIVKTSFRKEDKTYQVALLLPLFLGANDTINRIAMDPKELLNDSVFMSTYKRGMPLPTDTFKFRKNKIIDPRSENFLHLYEGILLAVDSLRKQGMKLDLYVFDTNRDSAVVESIIHKEIFREMDLIIGPVFPELQGNVSAYSAKNSIPMVSPLSSAGDFEKTNPYYFKLNPNKEYLINETARMIAEEYFDTNFIVLKMGEYQHLQEALLVSQCREQLFATGYYNNCKEVLYHECDFEKEGIWGLQRIMSKTRENVIIIPAVNEGQISIAITNLNTIAEQANIRLIGLAGFKGYRSIQPEYIHHLQLQYLTHYFIDYNNITVNKFISTFRKQFATEPNEFSFQGFDMAFYFMSALQHYGTDMVRYIPNFKLELTQLNLNFRKVSKLGGFMNYGLIDVSYDKDFNVVNKGFYAPNCLIPLKD